MKLKVSPARVLRGEVTPPGDKSISHRAAILNAIAQGKARVTNFSPGADGRATINCLRALGVTFEEQGPSSLLVFGVGDKGLSEASEVLDAANSGTTMRLMTGLLAAQPFFSVITGDASLRSRPMARVIEPLRLMGGEVWGRQGDSLPPLAIRGGPLRGIVYRLPVASAQLKSALLLAGLFAQGSSVITEPQPSRDHTERMLRAMGATVKGDGLRVNVAPLASPLTALDVQVPGDLSAAAFWLVAGAIHPQARITLRGVGVNPTRTGLLEVLESMGARVRQENQRLEGGEPVADLAVESAALRGTEIGGPLIPRVIDELPILAVAACLAQGTTVIRDAGELRVKESDRISTTVQELSRLGAEIEEKPDGMIVHGGRELRGNLCHSHGDHRLAMALGVAGLVARGETIIEGAEAVEISYPGFWQDMERLSRAGG